MSKQLFDFCRAMQYFGVGVVIIVGMNCLTGLIMFAYYYNCDPIKAKVYRIINE